MDFSVRYVKFGTISHLEVTRKTGSNGTMGLFGVEFTILGIFAGGQGLIGLKERFWFHRGGGTTDKSSIDKIAVDIIYFRQQKMDNF